MSDEDKTIEDQKMKELIEKTDENLAALRGDLTPELEPEPNPEPEP
jgi:hypothetical protein